MTTIEIPIMTAKAFVAGNVSAALTRHFRSTGETQVQLAGRAGIAQGCVSKYTAGRNTPNTETLIVLAEALGITIDALVLGAEPEASF
jgi:transcriptional regulator with XRE-family HTH domain